jgi:hypothetical protein
MLRTVRNFIGNRPVLLAAVALGVLALFLCSGCKGLRSLPHVQPPAVVSAAEDASAKVRRLEGELKVAKLERDDARLAGARRLLNWSTGILALCTIGLTVAAIYFRSKAIALAALSCAGGAAACQVFQRALDHIGLISWIALAVVAAVGAWLAWRYHRD